MKRINTTFSNNIARSLSLLILLFLTSCSTTPPTVASASMTGFGGTGHSPSGFGGTGIVGTVTKFGSIWVNGVEVEYGHNTQVHSRLAAREKLKLGQQVVLETLPNAHKIETRRISVYYPVAGRITRVRGHQITINNRYVVNTHRARRDRGVHLRVGEHVAINGFANSRNTWTATRINRNDRHQSFYQPVPSVHFSGAVKQVLIETSVSQLRQWGQVKSGLRLLARKQGRVIMIGHYKNNRIQIDAVKPYASVPKSSPTTSMLHYFDSAVKAAHSTSGFGSGVRGMMNNSPFGSGSHSGPGGMGGGMGPGSGSGSGGMGGGMGSGSGSGSGGMGGGMGSGSGSGSGGMGGGMGSGSGSGPGGMGGGMGGGFGR